MKKIDIDTFLKYKFISDPKFSPGGKRIGFVVSYPDMEMNGYISDLFIYELETKKLMALTSGRQAGAYTWADDSTLVFSDRAEASGDKTVFFRQDIHCGEAQEYFSLPGQVRSVYSMGGGRLALAVNVYVGEADKDLAYEVIEEVPFWANGAGYTNCRRTGIFIYDSLSGAIEKVTGRFEDCLSVSVDGSRILYTSCEWENVRPIKPGIHLYDDLTSMVLELLPQGEMYVGPAVFCGEDMAVFGATKGESYGQNQFMDFYSITFSSREMKVLKKYGYSIGSNTVGTDSRFGGGTSIKALGENVYFLTTLEESGVLRRLTLSGELSLPLTPEGSCDSFDITSEHCVMCGFFEDKLSELYVDGVQVTDFNKAMAEYDIIPREYMEITARDGEKIHGYVMKPAGFDAGKAYPALLHIHGGPRTVFGNIFHHEMQMLCHRGYFVFFCNPRGSDGRGDVFGCIDGHFGTVDYEDLMAFTDEVIGKYPQIDKKRLGVFGGSYGGFMTNWIIGHTNRFLAAVSQRCVTNWVSMEFMSDIGHFFVPQSMGGSAFDDVSPLWEQSPLKYAANCKTPTLFIHSDADYRCPLTEGMQMFAALKLVGCETRLCVIKGENHELSRSGRPSRRIRRMKEIVAWMDRHLKEGRTQL